MSRLAHPRLSELARHVRATGLLPDGARVLAAVSGGGDSIALLAVLDELRRAGHLDLVAGHVHHGLRDEEADADTALVEATCRRLGVPLLARRADTLAARRIRRRGLEDAARAVRGLALEEMRREAGCALVALAHSADDQAETVLLRLVRGSGPEGLGGMRAAVSNVVRPLLGVRRAELRRHLLRAGLAWRSDPTNWGGTSARALVRPLLVRAEECLNTSATLHVARAARLLAEESAWLDEQAEAAGRAIVSGAGDASASGVRVGARALTALPPVLARRLVRSILRRARPGAPPPSEDAVRRVLLLAASETGLPRQVHLSGLVVTRRGGEIVFGTAAPRHAPTDALPLPVPGQVRWGTLGTVRTLETDAPGDPMTAVLRSGPVGVMDRDTIPGALIVRAPRPDDRFRPAGSSTSRRLTGLLRDRRVPAADRAHVAVVCLREQDETIACVAGHGVGHAFRVTPGSRRLLLVEWRPSEPPGEPR